MANPFDDDAGEFCVLINQEEQYSLWPMQCEIPGGWSKVFGPDGRSDCLAYIEENWVDMRPKSLRDEYEAALTSA
ncbi:protein mbtH [Tateyamaria omphalii]|uniref:MbtH family protein n=1 Tax=Tateyamaria omphalii TaxID=299262 RepID=UPI0016721254|nr:MbtH family protein [Tateyamaria omphalii]GGX69965.1 protein mbtH [Tateyamaria omphalii]